MKAVPSLTLAGTIHEPEMPGAVCRIDVPSVELDDAKRPETRSKRISDCVAAMREREDGSRRAASLERRERDDQ